MEDSWDSWAEAGSRSVENRNLQLQRLIRKESDEWSQIKRVGSRWEQ